MAHIVKSVVDAKVRVPACEPIGAQDSDSDIGSGVSLVGVTDLVSDSCVWFLGDINCLSQVP